jgi:hypothetical protein
MGLVMKYPFILRPLDGGAIELRFPDLIGARAVFPSERSGANNAIAVLMDWIRERQQNRRRVPLPSAVHSSHMHVVLPTDLVESIHRHNQMLEMSGEIQDMA